MLAASSISNKFLCPIIYQLDKNLKTSVILFLSLFEVMLINEITRKEKRAMRNVIQYNLQKELLSLMNEASPFLRPNYTYAVQ
ncbi:Uncharacterized protein BM_BM619 [Brugia malayi]|uniref:Bm619 n=2 Tax=Brugia malayi TaxID=6279 RepID=A0A0H5SAC8_BRUMA|nr:Uncharacterized protein BM_BM619 [Brugia malayi]CRZ25304.1 Bm619 [Brugia malayi]VIO91179.1 Uncharacterized protein BM_BM619 [Brugia malayi]